MSGVGDVALWSVDHVQPVKNGGSQWDRSNLQALCRLPYQENSGGKHVSRESGLEIVSSGVGRTDGQVNMATQRVIVTEGSGSAPGSPVGRESW